MTEHLINIIKQDLEHRSNIASAIIEQEHIDTSIWILTLRISTKTNPVLRENQLEQYKIMFKLDYNQYNRREAIYEINLTKAYALFWGKCSKEMQNKIESRPQFKSILWIIYLNF